MLLRLLHCSRGGARRRRRLPVSSRARPPAGRVWWGNTCSGQPRVVGRGAKDRCVRLARSTRIGCCCTHQSNNDRSASQPSAAVLYGPDRRGAGLKGQITSWNARHRAGMATRHQLRIRCRRERQLLDTGVRQRPLSTSSRSRFVPKADPGHITSRDPSPRLPRQRLPRAPCSQRRGVQSRRR